MEKSKACVLVVLIILLSVPSAYAQRSSRILYKQVGDIELFMKVVYPEAFEEDGQYPAIVFFHGGGFRHGSIEQFMPHAEYFAKRGIISFLPEYRVEDLHQTTPFEALKDAKTAMRFVRSRADRFYLDTTRIAAAGGSAGGCLAAATALVSGFNESTDDQTVSCRPDALVLFNPVIDNGPGGYGYERIGEEYRSFSPLHNIKRGAPPTLIQVGTEDRFIPVATGKYYETVMEKVNSRCDLVLYKGEGHGFFNFKYPDNYRKTIHEASRFLKSLGYITDTP